MKIDIDIIKYVLNGGGLSPILNLSLAWYWATLEISSRQSRHVRAKCTHDVIPAQLVTYLLVEGHLMKSMIIRLNAGLSVRNPHELVSNIGLLSKNYVSIHQRDMDRVNDDKY